MSIAHIADRDDREMRDFIPDKTAVGLCGGRDHVTQVSANEV
jgi:hypothetical protein